MSDSDSEGAAMAAAMGFSSFGGKPAAKKRKFNPTTDAFVEGQALEKLDRGGKKGTGSGGNMIPLGKQRVIGQKKERAVQNEQEITLDEDDEEGSGEDGPQYIDTSRTPPAADDDAPQYIDTSEPPPVVPDPAAEAEAQEMQRRIDAILESIGSAPPPPSNDIDPLVPPGTSSHSYTGPPDMLPPPPLPATDLPDRGAAGFMQGGSRVGFTSGASGGRSDAGSSWEGSSRGGNSRGGHAGRGERNEKWYLGYYDATFNVNPWEALEKERGLEAVGSWLEYPKNQGRGGQRA